MTQCEIIAFPSVRRVGLVRNLADLLTACRPKIVERELSRQLEIQRKAMARRGLADDVIEREVHALEATIRAALCHVEMTGGDAA